MADTTHAAVREPAQRESKDQAASTNVGEIAPKADPDPGDSRLTDEDRAALLALIDGDDLALFLDDVCGDDPDLVR